MDFLKNKYLDTTSVWFSRVKQLIFEINKNKERIYKISKIYKLSISIYFLFIHIQIHFFPHRLRKFWLAFIYPIKELIFNYQ